MKNKLLLSRVLGMKKRGFGGKVEEIEAAWKNLTLSQFLKGYSAKDVIYDNLQFREIIRKEEKYERIRSNNGRSGNLSWTSDDSRDENNGFNYS